VDANLLESVAPDRYKFHDLLRVYASERAVADLAEPDRKAAITRLLRWYMYTADAAGTVVLPHGYNIPLDPVAASELVPLSFTGPEDALAWYDWDRLNIVAATRQAAASGSHDIAWRLPAPLFWVFLTRGNWVDCIATHRIALDCAREAGNKKGEAWVLNNLGEALGYTRDADGVGYLEQSLEIRREIGDLTGEAQTLNNLADLYAMLGRRDEALDMLHRGLELSREAGSPQGEGVALVNIGDALLGLDRAEEAIEWLQQAHATFTEIKESDGIGYALHHLGRCYLVLDRDTEALDCFRQALASHQAAGNRHREALTLRFLGRAQARNGLFGEARESWARSAAIYADLGDSAQAAQVGAELDENS
jgi:tetratricopeptide (TPR) repeat protein